MITERKKLLRAPSCRALDRILRTNQRQAPRAAYPENGEACCTSKLAVGATDQILAWTRPTGRSSTHLLQACSLNQPFHTVRGTQLFR